MPVEETRVQSLGWESPLRKEMVIHFSILAWKIPWTEEPGELHSMGHKESDKIEHMHTQTHTHAHTHTHTHAHTV